MCLQLHVMKMLDGTGTAFTGAICQILFFSLQSVAVWFCSSAGSSLNCLSHSWRTETKSRLFLCLCFETFVMQIFLNSSTAHTRKQVKQNNRTEQGHLLTKWSHDNAEALMLLHNGYGVWTKVETSGFLIKRLKLKLILPKSKKQSIDMVISKQMKM